MNWKLILQLSLFGLVMGVATVFLIPSNIEPFFWLPILVFCGYWIARHTATGRFLHGLLLGVVNSIWITGAHILFFEQYIQHHAQESAMMANSPLPARLMMGVVGLISGLVSGAVIGLFTLIAGKLLKGSADKPKAMGQSA